MTSKGDESSVAGVIDICRQRLSRRHIGR